MSGDIHRKISAALLNLKARHPFFATLSLFAPIQLDDQVPSAATDGVTLYFNPRYIDALGESEFMGLLCHEVLHMALLHVPRGRGREPTRWNVACDVVVNAMVRAAGMQLPAGVIVAPHWEHLSAEEIYARLALEDQAASMSLTLFDLSLEMSDSMRKDPMFDESALSAKWRIATQQAKIVSRNAIRGQAGSETRDLGREWRAAHDPSVDWRQLLWQEIATTPTDYEGYDRRLIWTGTYIDAVAMGQTYIAVCVDTSASISNRDLDDFATEMASLLRAYPHMRCDLFFCDVDLKGPFPVRAPFDLPAARGGGGTDLRPFFQWVETESKAGAPGPDRLVFFTDGYGPLPDRAPSIPTVWVVPEAGLETEKFPFGLVVKLTG